MATGMLVLLSADIARAQADAAPLTAVLVGKAPVRVDGDLGDPVWAGAASFDSFHEYEPRNGATAPPSLRTSVRLLIDDTALVFGIRAWDSQPSKMTGSLTRRDKVSQDQDFIGIWIDPSGHGRAAQFVRVNIAGAISDGLYRADDDESDLGPDFPVDAAVKILPDGYSMEVRWPLSSLRFPYHGGKHWRAMIERSVPHADSLLLMSTALKSGSLSRIATLQRIDGMGDTVAQVRDRAFVELKPELTVRQSRARVAGAPDGVGDGVGDGDGAPGAGGGIVSSQTRRSAAGLEIAARPRADWVLNATINPDYSQVEIDEPTSSGASRIALSLPEKRGFFLESADVLGLPLAAFYSRTVADPAWGMRATWRAAHLDATGMSLRDQAGGVVLRGSAYATDEYLQTRETSASMARTRWHGDGLLLGAFLSRRSDGRAGSNEVAAFDGQWNRSSASGAQQQAAWLLMHSQTTSRFDHQSRPLAGPARRGGYFWTKYSHSSADWWNEVRFEAIGPQFINDNGFVPQTGVVKTDVNLNRRLGPQAIPALGLELYEFEAHLGLNDVRTLSDPLSGQTGGQIVQRKFQPGIWLFGPRQTRLFVDLGFDQQRAHPLGRLHDTPALHFGFGSSPFSWLSKAEGEFTVGRQLDVEADRVGRGGDAMLTLGTRWALPRGWAMELDQRWNRAWVRGAAGHKGFSDSGWRTLAMLHMTPQDSLRLIVQNTAAARYDGGADAPDPWAERGNHRSLLYRHLWRHGRSMSLGYARDGEKYPYAASAALTLKFQWEL